MLTRDLVHALTTLAPLHLAAEWDNVGLLLGSPREALKGPVLLTIDLTQSVLDEAAKLGAGAIVCYHPPIFGKINRLTDRTALDGLVLQAARIGLAIYSPHTALDSVPGGMADWLADQCSDKPASPKAALPRYAPLVPDRSHTEHVKLVTFLPRKNADAVRDALSAGGAGRIGAYSHCSFSTPGEGTFFGEAGAAPAIGKAGRLERVSEVKLEMLCPRRELGAALAALRCVHPYQEPAIDVLPLLTEATPAGPGSPGEAGTGRIVELTRPLTPAALARRVQSRLKVSPVLASPPASTASRPITKLAVCPGAGESLLDAAADAGCHAFFTGEMKHHEILHAHRAGLSIILAGHTQTERGYLPTLAANLRPLLRNTRILLSKSDRAPLDEV